VRDRCTGCFSNVLSRRESDLWNYDLGLHPPEEENDAALVQASSRITIPLLNTLITGYQQMHDSMTTISNNIGQSKGNNEIHKVLCSMKLKTSYLIVVLGLALSIGYRLRSGSEYVEAFCISAKRPVGGPAGRGRVCLLQMGQGK